MVKPEFLLIFKSFNFQSIGSVGFKVDFVLGFTIVRELVNKFSFVFIQRRT